MFSHIQKNFRCQTSKVLAPMSFRGGLTLVELLVVVSIISLLSSIVLSALNSARANGRDAVRIRTVEEYIKALVLSYDKYGSYPGYAGINTKCLGSYPPNHTCGSNNSKSEDATLNSKVAEFLPSLPPIEAATYQRINSPYDEVPVKGIEYYCVPSGNDCKNASIQWGMEKDNECTVGQRSASYWRLCSLMLK